MYSRLRSTGAFVNVSTIWLVIVNWFHSTNTSYICTVKMIRRKHVNMFVLFSQTTKYEELWTLLRGSNLSWFATRVLEDKHRASRLGELAKFLLNIRMTRRRDHRHLTSNGPNGRVRLLRRLIWDCWRNALSPEHCGLFLAGRSWQNFDAVSDCKS